MKILAVDDDEFALDILETTLRGAGYTELTTATSAQEALDIINANSIDFDAFLLDIRMPGMDGIELCGIIRQMPKYSSSPIVMITAMQERHFIDQAFSAGAIDYITKPFDPMELGVRIGIAHRLSAQSRQVEQSKTDVALMMSRTGIGPGFDASEAIEIRDVPRVISAVAMENYLLRLSYSMAVKSTSVVFSIDGFEAICSQFDASEVYDILADTASAIVEGLKQVNHIVAYVGNGEFVAVVHGGGFTLSEETLWAIQAELDLAPPCLSRGREYPVNLSMGNVYSPSMWQASNRLGLLLSPKSRNAMKRGQTPVRRSAPQARNHAGLV